MAEIGAADMVTQGAAAAGFAKILVDLVKMSPIPSPSIVLPIFAFIFSEASAFLLFMANGGTFTSQNVALTVLIGIAATAGAIGITAAQNQANK